MSYSPETLLTTAVPRMDDGLFNAYQIAGAAGTETYGRLLPGKEQLARQKEAFFASGATLTPDLRPTNLDETDLANEAVVLNDLKTAVDTAAVDATIADLYKKSLNERIANVYMLQSIEAGDGRRFDAYNNFVYGSYDPTVFGGAVDWLCADAERSMEVTSDPALRTAAHDVLDLFDGMRGDRSGIVPTDETFQAVRADHFKSGGYYALLLSDVGLAPGQTVTPENGEPALAQLLANLESDYQPVDARGASWSVSHADRQVKRPAQYAMPYERFVGLGLGHEIGSHLLEAVNGGRSALGLAGSGLDRADNGNEGRAIIREQVMYPDFERFAATQRWNVILRRQVATALGLEAAGRSLEFPEVFAHINALDKLYERRLKPGDIAAADTKAANRSWALMQEIYKGTNGTSGPYRRYKLYAEGNAACWQTAATDPGSIRRGDLAKFDITNTRHVTALEKYAVIPPLNTYNDGVYDGQ